MSWITIVWSINAGACLTLAAIYLVVWCRQRERWVHLLFSCSAIAAAAIAVIELAMLHTQTVERYEALVRWIHVPTWVLLLSFVAFVRLYLRAGRPWLAWSIYGLRTLVLIVNLILTPSINFRKITGIHHLRLWGGEVASLPVGVPNPWGILSLISLLLIITFFVDATITVWRRGDRRHALIIGGSMIFGAVVAFHVPLVIWGVIHVPFFFCFAYTGIVAAMGYELSSDMFHAAQLTRKLKESEDRLALAAESANFGIWEWNLNKDEVRVTPSRRELLGFAPSGAIGFENFISRVHVEDRDCVRQAIQNAIEQRKVYDAEFRVLLRDGSVRWMTARGTVQVNGYEKPLRIVGVSIDVTARKQAELEAQQQRDELEQLRQQRTALLEREVSERTRLEREVIDICAREQRRIAYDLHDGVGQQLVGIALSAKLLEGQLRTKQPSEADKAGTLVKLANDAARQTRLTARTLEGADGVGDLKAALQSLATSVSRSCSLKASVTADGSSLPISPPVAAQLYRIAQEAVHNAVEHGAAREVQINLAFNGNNLLLTIGDNGKGFKSNANGAGMGLRIMRYRAQCIGGSCEVQTSSEGTVVSCRVPLEAQLPVLGVS
jgi:PAS domain S-box-containing protein